MDPLVNDPIDQDYPAAQGEETGRPLFEVDSLALAGQWLMPAEPEPVTAPMGETPEPDAPQPDASPEDPSPGAPIPLRTEEVPGASTNRYGADPRAPFNDPHAPGRWRAARARADEEGSNAPAPLRAWLERLRLRMADTSGPAGRARTDLVAFETARKTLKGHERLYRLALRHERSEPGSMHDLLGAVRYGASELARTAGALSDDATVEVLGGEPSRERRRALAEYAERARQAEPDTTGGADLVRLMQEYEPHVNAFVQALNRPGAHTALRRARDREQAREIAQAMTRELDEGSRRNARGALGALTSGQRLPENDFEATLECLRFNAQSFGPVARIGGLALRYAARRCVATRVHGLLERTATVLEDVLEATHGAPGPRTVLRRLGEREERRETRAQTVEGGIALRHALDECGPAVRSRLFTPAEDTDLRNAVRASWFDRLASLLQRDASSGHMRLTRGAGVTVNVMQAVDRLLTDVPDDGGTGPQHRLGAAAQEVRHANRTYLARERLAEAGRQARSALEANREAPPDRRLDARTAAALREIEVLEELRSIAPEVRQATTPRTLAAEHGRQIETIWAKMGTSFRQMELGAMEVPTEMQGRMRPPQAANAFVPSFDDEGEALWAHKRAEMLLGWTNQVMRQARENARTKSTVAFTPGRTGRS